MGLVSCRPDQISSKRNDYKVSCMVIGVARALTPCIRQIEDRVPA